MIKNGKTGQNGNKWSKLVKVSQNLSKNKKMAKLVKNDQKLGNFFGQKWPKKNGQNGKMLNMVIRPERPKDADDEARTSS